MFSITFQTPHKVCCLIGDQESIFQMACILQRNSDEWNRTFPKIKKSKYSPNNYFVVADVRGFRVNPEDLGYGDFSFWAKKEMLKLREDNYQLEEQNRIEACELVFGK